MKDFLKNNLLFFFPLSILFFIGIVFLPNKKNDYWVKREYLDAHSNEIETLILGSSHTYYDINPEKLSGRSFNAAYVSQTIDIDEAILFKYQHKWNHLKTIIIPIDYFTLFEQLSTGMESWRLKKYQNYWGIEQQERQYGYWYKVDIQFDILKDRFKKYISKDADSITCTPFGWGNIYRASLKTDLEKEGKMAAARHLLSDTACFRKNIMVVHQIINFAKANNSRILFITTPAYKTYTNLLDSIQLNTTFVTIQSIVAKENNCFYNNFLNDKDFTSIDFHDADHLNDIGANKFSIKIDSLIKNANSKLIFLNNKVY